VTLASSLTVNCRWTFTLLLSAGAVYYQLKQLRPVARSLSFEAAKTLVQAFVSSRLDYCNAILHGPPEKLMRRLQSVQNAAARMITIARRRDHITPILRQLHWHWLPVRQRVDFKIAVLVFRCLTGHAPVYLADDCQLAADASARRLRSADTAKCVVRRTYTQLRRPVLCSGRTTSVEHVITQLKTV